MRRKKKSSNLLFLFNLGLLSTLLIELRLLLRRFLMKGSDFEVETRPEKNTLMTELCSTFKVYRAVMAKLPIVSWEIYC